jgi:hypothetical protein
MKAQYWQIAGREQRRREAVRSDMSTRAFAARDHEPRGCAALLSSGRLPVVSSASIVVGLLLALVGPASSGKPTGGGKAAASAQPGPLQQVSELAKSAQARYETADYAGAIELWTQAYDLLPDAPEYASQRSVLAYQIGQACLEAYAIDPQVAYLRKADRLFAGYLQTIDPQDTETVAEIEGRLTDIRAKIAESERLAAERAERERLAAERAAAVADVAAKPDPEIEQARQAELAARRTAAERDAKRWRRISIAGGATTAVGAAMLAVMAYGLARGAKIDDRGDAKVADGDPDSAELHTLLGQGLTANRLAIAGGVLGGVLIATGVALVSAGVVRERRARKNLALAPTWLPGGAGVTFAARF